MKIFHIDPVSDPHWVAKEFFNEAFSEGAPIDRLSSLINGTSLVINDDGCLFPDTEEVDNDYHFTGVKFWVGNYEVTLNSPAFRLLVMEVINFLASSPNWNSKREELSILKEKFLRQH